MLVEKAGAWDEDLLVVHTRRYLNELKVRGLGAASRSMGRRFPAPLPVPAQWKCESAVHREPGALGGQVPGMRMAAPGVVSPHPWEHEHERPWGSKLHGAFGASASVTFHLASVDRPPKTLLG